MGLTPLQISALIFTYLVFGFLGYRLSRKFKRPVTLLTWIVLIIATIGGMQITPNAILVGVAEFQVLVNNTVQAIGLGLIMGLVTRELRLRIKTRSSL